MRLSVAVLISLAAVLAALFVATRPADDTHHPVEMDGDRAAVDAEAIHESLSTSTTAENATTRTPLETQVLPTGAPQEPAPGRANLTGLVLGLDGDPVAGAQVQIVPHYGTTLEFQDVGEPTGTDGRYTGLQEFKQFFVLRAWADGLGARMQGPFEANAALLETDFELGHGRTAAGRVVTADGTPVAGARVTVLAELDRPDVAKEGFRVLFYASQQPIGFTHTGADGGFRIRGLTDRTWRIEVALEQESETWRAILFGVAPGTEAVEIVLGPPLAVDVSVIDDTGAPVEGAKLRWRPAPNGEVGYAEPVEVLGEPTDAAGSSRVTGLFPGPWNLRARLPGMHQRGGLRALLVDLPTEDAVRVVLERGATIKGRVADAAGRPVPGANVGFAHFAHMHIRCDDEGRFVIEGAPPGPLTIVAGQRKPEAQHALVLAPGVVIEGLELRLGTSGAVTVTVLDSAGEPVADTGVRLVRGLDDGAEQQTDASGVAHFRGLHAGRWIAVTESQETPTGAERHHIGNYLSGEVDVVAGEERALVLRAQPVDRVRIEGTARRAGEAMQDARVYLMPEGGLPFAGGDGFRVRDDGFFRGTVLRPGLYLLGVVEGRGPVMPPRPVTVPDVELHRITIEVPVGSVTGIVKDSAGAGVPAQTRLVRFDGRMFAIEQPKPILAVSGDDGRFAFEDVDGGTYRIAAHSLQGSGFSEPFVIEGTGVLTEVVLAPVMEVGGEVSVPGGELPAQVFVYAWDARGRVLDRLPTPVREDGTFLLETFPRTGGHLLVVAPGMAAALDVAADTSEPLAIALDPAGALEVRCEDTSGAPAPARFEVRDSAGRDHTHLFDPADIRRGPWRAVSLASLRLAPLPPGEYEVRARVPDGEWSHAKARVAAGRTERVRIVL